MTGEVSKMVGYYNNHPIWRQFRKPWFLHPAGRTSSSPSARAEGIAVIKTLPGSWLLSVSLISDKVLSQSLLFQPSLVGSAGICTELCHVHLYLKHKENRGRWYYCKFRCDLLLQIVRCLPPIKCPKTVGLQGTDDILDLIFSSYDTQ